MNKHVALKLLDKLAGATYLDRTSGIVQVITKTLPANDDLPGIQKRLPYTSFATHEQCGKPEYLMIPNSKFKSCLYFEDGGAVVMGNTNRGIAYQSKMRLVCWINTIRIAGAFDSLLSTKITADVIKRLTLHTHTNPAPFINMSVKRCDIPTLNAGIFSPYDYDEKTTQFLMPPYDFFALDLVTEFVVPNACLDDIVATNAEPCPPKDAQLTEQGALIRDDNNKYLKTES